MIRPRTVDPVMAARRAAEFTTRSIKASSKDAALRLAVSMTDLTTLEGADTPERVHALCDRARHPVPGNHQPPVPPVAAVCVYPTLVSTAKARLAGTNIKVASVATAFPSGQAPLEIRLEDVAAAVEAGADEIDMVINRGAFLAGRYDEVQDEIAAVKRACGEAHLKIILETGELGTLDRVRLASDLAIEAGTSEPVNGERISDGEVFIKTSTGKISPAATMPVVLVMLEAIRDRFLATGEKVGMKPAGGIRASKAAIHHLVMLRETLGSEWLTPALYRFGASSLLDDLGRQILRRSNGRYAGTGDIPTA
jgi:deoxyribose-phosphate aldolase